MKKLSLLLLLTFIALSCKSKKILDKPTSTNVDTANTSIKTDVIPTKVENKNLVYANAIQQLSSKAKINQIKILSTIDAQLSRFVPPIDATIYIENDKKIWMNLSSLFLPVARGMAEPNSVKAYEKINRTYIDSDYAYLNQLLKVDFINYNNLQSILLGKLFLKIDLLNDVFEKKENYTKISVKQPLKMTVNKKTSMYQVFVSFNQQNQLQSILLQNKEKAHSFEIQYSNWVNLELLEMPKNVKIIINTEKKEQILIENTKFDFSKINTPYEVPNNYKKTILK